MPYGRGVVGALVGDPGQARQVLAGERLADVRVVLGHEEHPAIVVQIGGGEAADDAVGHEQAVGRAEQGGGVVGHRGRRPGETQPDAGRLLVHDAGQFRAEDGDGVVRGEQAELPLLGARVESGLAGEEAFEDVVRGGGAIEQHLSQGGAGPFALATLSRPGGPAFPVLVTAAEHVIDLRSALDDERLTVRDVLEDWDALLPRLRELAAVGGAGREPPPGPAVHAPVEPRQVFQSGANYRRHVIDLHVAHRAPGDDRPESERRAEAAEIMDRRAAEDLPYVFIGLPTSIIGPYDDVVLPAWAEKPDWELELAAVIGRPAHRVSVEEALEYGLT
ncbi:Fumarylacetoacetate (FAA) hydrolase family protein [Streptomyces misionensis]|uniref:Fumarylacetoacetate (FAA) hydrolase family protein n=1 Tax=Streptomyces misionensis TaxID=67331 RepID=A0A1H5HK26_9ACTN|nr:Fumarylacetoacetate (FAA) hydrolase family protein [Streptomyces misionensis]